MSDVVLVHHSGDHVATVTINRPEARNALDTPTLDALDATLRELDADVDVRAIVLRGAGPRAFVAGGDLKEMVSMSPLAFHTYVTKVGGLLLTMISLDTPVIAGVDGYAYGGGMSLCLGSDLVIANEMAKFGMSEIKVGLFGGFEFLAASLGKHRAAELVLLGETLTATQGHDWGFVNRVTSIEDFEEVLDGIARQVASVSPIAVTMAKRSLRVALDQGPSAVMDTQSALMSMLFGTHDQYEAMTAFLEKRAPRFTGDKELREGAR